MRYDCTVKFTNECKVYDESLGKEVFEVLDTKTVRANVTDASEKVMSVAFGDIRQSAKVVRMQGHLSFKPTHVYLGSIRCKVAMVRILRRKTTLVVEEVSVNG